MDGARRAEVSDVERLADLARLARDELAAMRGGDVFAHREFGQEPLDDGLRAARDAADTLVLAGTIDDVVVGYAVASVEALADDRRLGVITDLFVEPEAREVGVGERMMDEVI